MKLTEFQQNLRLELGDTDPDSEAWSTDELARTVDAAIHDLDRYLPLTKVYEVTISPTVTGEAWTSGAAHGTYVTLANTMLKPGSEIVTNAAGTVTYTRDTDYTINYTDGKITTISGGDMVVATAHLISYTKSKISVDISGLTDLIRISAVEYPMGNVPQTFVGFKVVAGVLYIQTTASTSTQSQTEMSEGKHIAIYYEAVNTGPCESASPSFPRHLDEVVIMGAMAHSFYILSGKQSRATSEDMDSARDMLADIDTIMLAVAAALANVDGHFTDADTALGNLATYQGYAKDMLDEIPTQVAAAAAAMTSAGALADEGATAFDSADAHLDAVATILANVGTKVTLAETALGAVASDTTLANDALTKIETERQLAKNSILLLLAVWDLVNSYFDLALNNLSTGAPLINKVNVGNDPANQYRLYCEAEMNGYIGARDLFQREYKDAADGYISLINAYIGEASQHVARANARVAEGSQRVALVDAYLNEAVQRINAANGWIAKASGIATAAGTYVSISAQRVALVNAYINAAMGYFQACNSYIEEAKARVDMGKAYISEAEALLTEIQGKLAAANQYAQLAAQAGEVAKNLRLEGDTRKAAYISTLRDRAQWITERVVTSPNQPMA